MNRIFLIGYMGVGKTTIGIGLSRVMRMQFVDLDTFIENKYRKTIKQLFDEKGEDAFRKIEQIALQEVAAFQNTIISTGGGAPCFFDNMQLMNDAGTTLYLKAEPEELASWLKNASNNRPLIAGKSDNELLQFVKQHLAERESYYSQATITYHTSLMASEQHVEQTIKDIANQLNTHRK